MLPSLSVGALANDRGAASQDRQPACRRRSVQGAAVNRREANNADELAGRSAAVGLFVPVGSMTVSAYENAGANKPRARHSRPLTATPPTVSPCGASAHITTPAADPYIPQATARHHRAAVQSNEVYPTPSAWCARPASAGRQINAFHSDQLSENPARDGWTNANHPSEARRIRTTTFDTMPTDRQPCLLASSADAHGAVGIAQRLSVVSWRSIALARCNLTIERQGQSLRLTISSC